MKDYERERKALIKTLINKIQQGANTNDIDPDINAFIEAMDWEERAKEFFNDIEQVGGKPVQEKFNITMENLKQGYKEKIYKDIYITLKYKNGIVED